MLCNRIIKSETIKTSIGQFGC